MRTCAKCEVEKSSSDFYRTTRRRDGLMAACKVCHSLMCAERRKGDPSYLARWREKNPTAWTEWYAANKSQRAEYNRRWREQNQEANARRLVEWARNNPAKINARVAKRVAIKLVATPKWADTDAIERLYERAAELTKSTGIRHEVDHIVPLQGKIVTGLHCESNLQILTKAENIRKLNRLWPDMP